MFTSNCVAILVILTVTCIVHASPVPKDQPVQDIKDQPAAANTSNQDGALADPKPTPTGISNFVGIGYNIIDGNPEGGDLYKGGVDPGLLVTRPILKLTYDTNQLTSDLQYQVPDQVVFTPRSSCVTTSTQEVFYGTATYVEKVEVDIEESLRIGGIFTRFKFSGSSRYESVQAGIDAQKTVYYEERTVCNKGQARYRTELAIHDKYPLDRGFVADACSLKTTYDQDTYMNFLEDWGTHIITDVDLGTKSTDRYEETQQSFVHYAHTNVDGSVSFQANIVPGFKGGVVVDMDTFESGLTTGMQFGSLTHNFWAGGDDLPEPIAMKMIGMHEVFDEDFWQRFDDYVTTGICAASWINSSHIIQNNVERALNEYAVWKNADASSDPIVAIPITWPKGTYALPKPNAGCANTHLTWQEGYRYQDTEDSFSDNHWSSGIHLAGPLYDNNMYQRFCSKTVLEADIYDWPFQSGRYCVFKKGSTCPSGLKEGWVYWDDEDTSNDNRVDGEVPEGNYDHNTRLYYCCQNDGFATNPIYLPTDEPFYLFKEMHQCQEVYGMKVTAEYFRWDTQDMRNDDADGGTHPYQGKSDNVLLEYCYYEPL